MIIPRHAYVLVLYICTNICVIYHNILALKTVHDFYVNIIIGDLVFFLYSVNKVITYVYTFPFKLLCQLFHQVKNKYILGLIFPVNLGQNSSSESTVYSNLDRIGHSFLRNTFSKAKFYVVSNLRFIPVCSSA